MVYPGTRNYGNGNFWDSRLIFRFFWLLHPIQSDKTVKYYFEVRVYGSKLTNTPIDQPAMYHHPSTSRTFEHDTFTSQPHMPQSNMPRQQMEMRFPDNRRTHDHPKFSDRLEEWFLFINSFIMTTQQFGSGCRNV